MRGSCAGSGHTSFTGIGLNTALILGILDSVVEMMLSLVMRGMVVETLLSVDIMGMVVIATCSVVLLLVVVMVGMLVAALLSVDILGLVGDTMVVVMVGLGVEMLSVDVLGLVGDTISSVVLLLVMNSPVDVVPILSVVLKGTLVVVRPGRRAHFYSPVFTKPCRSFTLNTK